MPNPVTREKIDAPRDKQPRHVRLARKTGAAPESLEVPYVVPTGRRDRFLEPARDGQSLSKNLAATWRAWLYLSWRTSDRETKKDRRVLDHDYTGNT